MATAHLNRSEIVSVQFFASGSEDIKRNACACITKADIFKDNEPVRGGIYTPALGTTDYYYSCATCRESKDNCIGHPGEAPLNVPLFETLRFQSVSTWLRVICHACGVSVYTEEELAHVKGRKLEGITKGPKTGGKICPSCNYVQPTIPKRSKGGDKKERHVIIVEYPDGNKRLYAYHVLQILSRITASTVLMYGKKVESHPSKFVLTSMVIPAVTIRPNIKKMGSGGGKSSNDELTAQLNNLMRNNETLKGVDFSKNISDEIDAHIAEFQSNFNNYNNGKATNPKAGVPKARIQLSSIPSKLKGKDGRTRGNLVGKRTSKVIRATIIGDTSININQVGISVTFARELFVEETITHENYKHMLKFFLNRRDRYPGCSRVKKHDDNEGPYLISGIGDYQLRIGDVIYRDIIDGDIVYFNRQPSLRRSGLGGHYVKIIHDPNLNAICMNVLACQAYDADFDGDQMNIYMIYSKYAINEVRELGGLHNSMVTYNHGQFFGQVQDSVIGLALLTKDATRMTKFRAMQLFSNTTIVPDFSEYDKSSLISGRDLLSMTLPRINYSTTASFYNKAYAPYLDYSPTETNVSIRDGKIHTGVIDKRSIGGEVDGSIYRIITAEFGPQAAMDCIFNHQQVAIEFLRLRGFSTGIGDVIMSAQGRVDIHESVMQTMSEVERLNNMLIAGDIIPPLGVKLIDWYEQLMQRVMQDEMIEPLFKNLDYKTNGLMQMILHGSKGKLPNLKYSCGIIGQRNVADKRVELKFENRVSPYHRRGDLDPTHRGYIPVSYADGQTSYFMVPDFMKARKEVIDKSITVGESGDMSRNAGKNIDPNTVDNLYRTVKGTRFIVQELTGDDGFDARRQEKVKLTHINMSDKDLHAQCVEGLKSESAAVTRACEHIKRDRDEFRRNFMRIERIRENTPMDSMIVLAVNIGRVYSDLIYAYGEQKASSADIDKMLSELDKFIEELPYLYSNDRMRENKTPIERRYHCGIRYHGLSVRWELRPARIAKLTPDMLSLMFEKLKTRIRTALIAPGTPQGVISAQCIFYPFTQGMLQSINKVGGGAGGKSIATKAKELYNARPIDKITDPAMFMMLKDPYNREAAQRVANNIEVLRMSNFVTRAPELFYESYGNPVHPNYIHEKKMFAEFEKATPRAKPPADLVDWCVRFELNKVSLIQKNMSFDEVISALKTPNNFLVHTDQNSEEIIIRAYFRAASLKKVGAIFDEMTISVKAAEMMNTVIRGISGIIRADVIENIQRTVINGDMSTSLKSTYAITTIGVNIPQLLTYPEIDHTSIQSDSIDAVFTHYGIEAARLRIINEIRSMLDGLSYKHYEHFASEMTLTGRVTSIQRAGNNARDPKNVLLRISHAAPVKVLEQATIDATECEVYGIAGSLMVGDMPKVGTLFDKLCVNQEFVRTNKTNVSDMLDAL